VSARACETRARVACDAWIRGVQRATHAFARRSVGTCAQKNYCVKKIGFLYSRIDTIHRTARGYCVAAAVRDVLQVRSSVRVCAPGAIVSRVVDALLLPTLHRHGAVNTGGWCSTLSVAPRRRDVHVTIPPINRRLDDTRAAGTPARRVLHD
jgi:hypothetical protein